MPDEEPLKLSKRISRSQWEDLPADMGVFAAECSYLLEGSAETLSAVREAYPDFCERLGSRALRLEFGTAVGFLDLPCLGRVEVRSGKWDQRHFDWMMAELTEIAAALPFTATLTAALPYERSVTASEDVLYHEFVYMRHILSHTAPAKMQLLPALEYVMRQPHRRFVRARAEMPTALARRVDPRMLEGIVSGKRALVDVSPGTSAVANALGGRLPEIVDESQVQVTVDTPENRFVKSFVRGIQFGIIDRMRDLAEGGSLSHGLAARLRQDCEWMQRRIRPIGRNKLWREVGDLTHVPAASPILQRGRGYKEVFRHFAHLRLAARVPFSKKIVRDLLEAKDIATLYELWCFFTVVRECEGVLGRPTASRPRPSVGPAEVTIPWEYAVEWEGVLRVLYNPRFSRQNASAARRSYSVPLRPDIGLHVQKGPNAGLHVMDAKFKVEKIEELLRETDDQEEGLDDEVKEERLGTFKRGDLYKMHTYRDALPAARSVWILYPGDEVKFYGKGGALCANDSETLTCPGITVEGGERCLGHGEPEEGESPTAADRGPQGGRT